MTRRSEPKPECGICKGHGFFMVSRDPDLDAECPCTDPVEPPTAAERIDAFAKSIEVELMPWQRELAVAILEAQPVALAVMCIARRGGLRTVRRVVDGARYV